MQNKRRANPPGAIHANKRLKLPLHSSGVTTTSITGNGVSHRSSSTPKLVAEKLVRGMTARSLYSLLPAGAADEIESDLAQIEANLAQINHYKQQCYMLANHISAPADAHVRAAQTKKTTNLGGKVQDLRMRKNLHLAESKREMLEGLYLSLRAHFVHESKRLDEIEKDESIKKLMELCDYEAHNLAQKRTRLIMASDLVHLKNRLPEEKVEGLRSSNKELRRLWEAASIQSKPPADIYTGKWKAGLEPTVMHNLPLLLSTLSTLPDRAAAASYKLPEHFKEHHSVEWLSEFLPPYVEESTSQASKDISDLEKIFTETEEEMEKCKQSNRMGVPSDINKIKRYNDAVSAQMALCRMEFESVLLRHNVIANKIVPSDSDNGVDTSSVQDDAESSASQEDLSQEESDSEPEDHTNTADANLLLGSLAAIAGAQAQAYEGNQKLSDIDEESTASRSSTRRSRNNS